MRRREFITLLGSAAATWPFAARAQQAMPTIGFLSSSSPNATLLKALRQGLSETGHVEGKNVAIEIRSADGQNDRLPMLAADLVRRQVAVIVASGNPSTLAAKVATTTIPIVFATTADPVAIGLVASLNRPSGNVTGATFLGAQLIPKLLELLHEIVPTANVVGLLVNPTNPTNAAPNTRDMQAAARSLGLQLHVLQASNERDFDAVFAALVQQRVRALVIGPDAFFTNQSKQLAELALRNAVPAIFPNRQFAAAGGLMSYGGDSAESFRLTGVYAGRILKGEKPADLPVQQSTKVEFVLNLKTAKALGLTVPLPLSGRADEVIE
jgi:putative ABC transport system substrate-binding protein